MMSRKPYVALIASILCLLAAAAPADPPSDSSDDASWWRHGVFYEIYPRSFADSNDDGIGDLRGITAKLDYLKDLGVDAIWLTPCYPSPQVDFGYDVSDYENIDPVYGTLKDFDQMEHEASKRGIRVIMDFVLNHTSEQHKWFVDSRSSRTSAHRDWYIWRAGKARGQPPNNWVSIFGGSAWKLDPNTNQYYYHRFYPEQPDLNWRNPAVENAMFDVTRWWYSRGVAGFRLDAVSNLFEDPDLRDNPLLPGVNNLGDPRMDSRFNDNLPEVHEALRDLRKLADEHQAVLIGETWASSAAELKQYYGEHGDELQMPMDLAFTKIESLSASEFRSHIAAVEAAGGWPVYVISNHDIVRSYTRYGDGKHNDAIAKLIAGLYLTLRGTPIMYYGEEIGMENNDPLRKEDVKDPVGRVGWPLEKGRDGERTPMQWDDTANAGFTRRTPWLPLPPSYKTRNVATEAKDPKSVLSFYKQLLAVRRHSPALLDGEYIAINQNDPNLLAYLRRSANQTVLVVLNMSAASQTAKFDFSLQGFFSAKTHALLSTAGTAVKPDLAGFTLEPFGLYIGEVVE
jgi:alpha-glucosidase